MKEKTYLHVAIAKSGFCSRRKAETLIREGRVKVNGKKVIAPEQKIDAEKDVVFIEGREIEFDEKKVYLLLNKPKGVLSATRDKRKKTVIDLVPAEIKERIFPVGRLDKDTTGLLILTNDGELTYRLTHPNFKVLKTYSVLCEGRLEKAKTAKLEKGIEIEGKRTLPARIKAVSFIKSKNKTSLLIEIFEGRKRQIRKMFLKAGHPVVELERVKYGDLTLGALKRGKTRPLTQKEIKGLKQKTGLSI